MCAGVSAWGCVHVHVVAHGDQKRQQIFWSQSSRNLWAMCSGDWTCALCKSLKCSELLGDSSSIRSSERASSVCVAEVWGVNDSCVVLMFTLMGQLKKLTQSDAWHVGTACCRALIGPDGLFPTPEALRMKALPATKTCCCLARQMTIRSCFWGSLLGAGSRIQLTYIYLFIYFYFGHGNYDAWRVDRECDYLHFIAEQTYGPEDAGAGSWIIQQCMLAGTSKFGVVVSCAGALGWEPVFLDSKFKYL